MTASGSSFIVLIPQADDDIHFSYLPLPHVFERIVQLGVVETKAAIGFWQGDANKLIDDLQALRPTAMPVVPRVLNRIYDKVMAGVAVAPAHRRAIFKKVKEEQGGQG